MKLKARHLDDLCDAHLCRADYETRYLKGATELNADRDLWLCAFHEKRLVDEVAEIREKNQKPSGDGPAQPIQAA
jgi:hypothetical protein